MKFIDKFLNSITMYRLVLYGLFGMSIYAIICGFLGFIPFSGWTLIGSLIIIRVVAGLTNYIFEKILKAATNYESTGITSLILFFILMPFSNMHDVYVLIAAAIIASASKYVFVYRKRHIFNPAAIAAAIISTAGTGASIWWVGSLAMLPAAVILGFLVVKKVRRFTLFWSFAITALAIALYHYMTMGFSANEVMVLSVTSWPLIFFGTIMLTEPLTTPPTLRLQVMYGILVGILFSAQFNLGPIYASPEIALVIGNIFSFIVSSHQKFKLKLKSKTQLSNLIYEFAFTPDYKLAFQPGQYLEWTLPNVKVDYRGNRRYFTVASSPTESEVKLGVRIQQDGSSFKKTLVDMKEGDMIAAGALSGEFVLPKDKNKKLVFIAGGIGVTPFRSMIKYLSDMKEKREVTLFYAGMTETDFVYKDIFEEAEKTIGLKVVYIVTDAAKVSEAWKGRTGFLTPELVLAEVPDAKERMFYLSGPDAMVQNYKKMILGMGVNRANIRTDYFPGF